nr:MAG TPA: head tail connector [Bacteriophage sp.]
MINVSSVKNYLKIPYDDDDGFIKNIITAGYDYLRGAIDDFDDIYADDPGFASKADLWVLTMYIPPAYDDREGAYSGGAAMSYGARAMLTQLQTYRVEDKTNGT